MSTGSNGWPADIAIALVFLLLSAPAHAGSVQALLKAKDCLVCHDNGKDRIGPSFRHIAMSFAGFQNARFMLIDIIHTGTGPGSGDISYHWGSARMPPEDVRVPVDDAEAGKMVDYILGLK